MSPNEGPGPQGTGPAWGWGPPRRVPLSAAESTPTAPHSKYPRCGGWACYVSRQARGKTSALQRLWDKRPGDQKWRGPRTPLPPAGWESEERRPASCHNRGRGSAPRLGGNAATKRSVRYGYICNRLRGRKDRQEQHRRKTNPPRYTTAATLWPKLVTGNCAGRANLSPWKPVQHQVYVTGRCPGDGALWVSALAQHDTYCVLTKPCPPKRVRRPAAQTQVLRLRPLSQGAPCSLRGCSQLARPCPRIAFPWLCLPSPPWSSSERSPEQKPPPPHSRISAQLGSGWLRWEKKVDLFLALETHEQMDGRAELTFLT